MGFFSSKETQVASSVYNLAGDLADRPNFLKSVVQSHIIMGSQGGITQSLRDSYIKGPGIKVQRFFNWAKKNYTAVGVPKGSLGSSVDFDEAIIQAELTKLVPRAGKTIVVQMVESGMFDYGYWAEQWMMRYYPDKLGTLWKSSIDSAGQIKITLADGKIRTFTPATNQRGTYIYTVYSYVDNTTQKFDGLAMHIYRVGSGIVPLDNMVLAAENDGEYAPFIPVRVDNKFLSPTYQPAIYKVAKLAYKKAVGADYDQLVDKIKENQNLAEIDHAYVVFGVALNTKEKAAREYLYRFFQKCMNQQNFGPTDYESYQLQEGIFLNQQDAWAEWQAAQLSATDPLYGTPAPTKGTTPAVPQNNVRIRSSGSFNTQLDLNVTWKSITESVNEGLANPTAKAGDIWLTVGNSSDERVVPVYTGKTILGLTFGKGSAVNIFWQVTADTWKKLTINGLLHTNLIYKKHKVDITGAEALADTEESGFIVPLHMLTLKEMSLVNSTQMMASCNYLVLNSVKTVKKKWYQTWWFSVILFVAVVAITIAFPPLGGAAGGVAGSAASVGAAIGLTGLAAIIAGTVINQLVAMLLIKILMMGASELFGEKWGALIGAVMAFATLQIGTGMSAGATFAQSLTSLGSAANIIQLTMAVGNGIAGFINGDTMETMQDIQKLNENYQKQSEAIENQYLSEFGDRGSFNPFLLTDVGKQFVSESRDQFLSRTLLTGSDIAQMTLDKVNNFTRYTLRLDLAA